MIQHILTQQLQHTYGLFLDLVPLAGELDLNFKGQSKEGAVYTVKLMRKDCQPDLIDFQCAALQHLAKRELTIGLPRVVMSLQGESYVLIEIEGEQRLLWVLTFCPGMLWADVRPHSPDLLYSLGRGLAQLTGGLEGFTHPSMQRKIRWELTEAMQNSHLTSYVQDEWRAIVQAVFGRFEGSVAKAMKRLPHSVIHNDANDYNVLVSLEEATVSAFFDFGDMSYQPTICELAVAMAYAGMGQEKPIQAYQEILRGYSSVRSLSVEEIQVLFDLIKTRLAVSIAISSYRQVSEPENSYHAISQAPAKDLLKQLDELSSGFAECVFREACGHPVLMHEAEIMSYLRRVGPDVHPVMEVDTYDHVLDLSVGSLLLGANSTSVALPNLTRSIDRWMADRKTAFAFGRYAESRRLYASSNFGTAAYPTEERRTQHLGIDIFCKAALPVFAPLDGIVEILTINELPLDYGGLLILRHETDQGHAFFTLYGHLSHDSLNHLEIGQAVKAGEKIATIGENHENGGWPPHVHVQIILDLLDYGKDFPGVCKQSESSIWQRLSPHPALLIPQLNEKESLGAPDPVGVLTERKQRLGFNLSISYAKPLHLVSGFAQFLYDSHAQAYLDVYNNVPHVGHSHPRVVKAIQDQIGLLNTNTRYLHEQILIYAERLTAKLPEGLDVCYFLNSASEANELALRLARTYTGRKDMLVVESAYHGHTSSLIDISPYKHDGPGGRGAPDWVHTVPIPDDYRGKWKRGTPEIGLRYAEEVQNKLEEIARQGRAVAGYIAETYPSVGGQIMPPEGYLQAVYAHVRAHGGLCIADEVQTGFGRLGNSFWGIDSQEVVPDIVIMGKPIANGFPMGALVTTREIAEVFDNGMEFFSTFGGNPVACAAATAVLDVVEQEQLQNNAQELGSQFLTDLREMQTRHDIIGDVRGEGFFLGIELVRNRDTLEAAAQEASYVVNRLRDHHILAGTDGPLHNVIKIRPSMVVEKRDMTQVVEVLDRIFQEISIRGRDR
ncbi:MAG: aminotransferase class III-fold pyridoxal phosphate-dependent enzyme [Bacteroidota bacterium]